jgi:thioredoxin 1
MKEVNSSTFTQEVLQSELPVLVDFYADWCGPCRMLSPTVHQLAEDYKGRLKVVQVNVDRAGDLAGAFGVSSIPTLICFRDGRALGRSVGLTGKAELEQRLRSWAAV